MLTAALALQRNFQRAHFPVPHSSLVLIILFSSLKFGQLKSKYRKSKPVLGGQFALFKSLNSSWISVYSACCGSGFCWWKDSGYERLKEPVCFQRQDRALHHNALRLRFDGRLLFQGVWCVGSGSLNTHSPHDTLATALLWSQDQASQHSSTGGGESS